MKDGSTFVSLDSGMVGKIPIPKSGCGPASSSLVKQMSWSPKYIPGCLSFCGRRLRAMAFERDRERNLATVSCRRNDRKTDFQTNE